MAATGKAGQRGDTISSDELRRADEDELVIWHFLCTIMALAICLSFD
jgi:hypothetical protein